MMGILWGYRELDEVEGRLPSNIMGSLGSLGIEWGYKIRPPKDDHDKESSKSGSTEEAKLEELEEEEHVVIEEIDETEHGLSQFSIGLFRDFNSGFRAGRRSFSLLRLDEELFEMRGNGIIRETQAPWLRMFSHLPVVGRLVGQQLYVQVKSVNYPYVPQDEVMANLLQFRERLEVKETATGKIIGHFTIDVDSMGEDNADFQVHLSGRALVGETECGTSVTTSVNRRLMTIEEKLHEFVKRKGNTKELHLYIAQDVSNEDGHYLHIACEQIVNEYKDKRVQEVPYEMVKNLVSEGASVLLMRLMALTGYEGTVDLMGVLTNAALYTNKFTCTGPSESWLNGEKQELITIQREGKDASGNSLTLKSTLTKTGELLEHMWVNGPFCLVISPLVERIGPVMQERKIPLHKQWEDDMQAMSIYLDYKTRRLACHHTYYEDRPEIEALIADFVQAILLVKPDDVISFTIDHFREFGKQVVKNVQLESTILGDTDNFLTTIQSNLASTEENAKSIIDTILKNL